MIMVFSLWLLIGIYLLVKIWILIIGSLKDLILLISNTNENLKLYIRCVDRDGFIQEVCN